jgi:hypothetical protein
MNKYPSLHARLDTFTADDGRRGSRVRCTISGADLGFIFWSSTGKTVVWNFRGPKGTGLTGKRNTERNAVQSLRDFANDGSLGLPFEDVPTPTDTDYRGPTLDTRPRPMPTSTPRPTPQPVAPTRRIVWGTPTNAADLTNAIVRGLQGKK